MPRIVLGVLDLTFLGSHSPLGRVKKISACEENEELESSEGAYRLHSRAFHLNRNASVSLVTGKIILGLAENGIGRPSLALDISDLVFLHKRLDGIRTRDVDIIGRGSIVIGSALIAVCGGGDHHLSACNFSVKAAAAAKKDIFIGRKDRSGVLDRRRSSGRADKGLEKGKFFVLIFPYTILAILSELTYKNNIIEELKSNINRYSNGIIGADKSPIHFLDENKVMKLVVTAESLLYIVASDNYVDIHYLSNGKITKYSLRNSMRSIEELCMQNNLLRCHRSYIVNLKKIKIIQKDREEGLFAELDISGAPHIPVSKKYAE